MASSMIMEHTDDEDDTPKHRIGAPSLPMLISCTDLTSGAIGFGLSELSTGHMQVQGDQNCQR